MRKIFICLILGLFLSSSVSAQDISISADVDRSEISMDEQLTLTIVVSGNVSNIPKPGIPPMKGFNSYSSGRSQNISIINGQVNSSVTFSYMLMPIKEGEYELGPFTIDYKGNTYSTGPIKVKVSPKGSASRQLPPQQKAYPPNPGQQPKSQRPGMSDGSKAGRQNKELFIETYVDKLRAYVNEQITLTFAFYQAVNLFENPSYQPPSTTGFWTEDMPPQRKYYKVIDGVKYRVTEIKTALFATSAGEFTIGEARLEASVEDLERFFSRSPFDIFDDDPFSMFRRGKPVVLTTDPIKVEIMPLPDEGKPEIFNGDVGRFDILASVDKKSVKENEPVSLNITIEGEGNIKTISSPVLPETEKAKIYDSGSSEDVSKEGYIVHGKKVFEKVIIPREEGTLKIGPIEYSYFDTAKKDYVTKKIEPIVINVSEADEQIKEGGVSLTGVSGEEIKVLKKDIRYIKTNIPVFRSQGDFLYRSKLFYLINILPVLVLISLYTYDKHRQKLRKDIGYARSLRAKKAASRRLKKAGEIITKGGSEEFYAEIYRAVIEYIADKLNISHPSITKDALGRKLRERGISDEDIIKEIEWLFDVCDMARFAAGKFSREDMKDTIDKASDIITGLEKLK